MGRRFVVASAHYIDVRSAAGLAGFDYRFGTIAFVVNFAALPATGASMDVYTNDATGASVDVGINTIGGVTGADFYDGTNNPIALAGAFAINTTYLLAFTKATGTTTGRAHLYVFSTGTWTHAALSGTAVDGAAVTSLSIDDPTGDTAAGLDGEMFAIAMWNGYAMSDLEVERLATGRWERWNPGFYDLWETSRDNGDMVNTLGRYRVSQTARSGALRGTLVPPPQFRSSPVRHRR